jgi:hypothetical protein
MCPAPPQKKASTSPYRYMDQSARQAGVPTIYKEPETAAQVPGVVSAGFGPDRHFGDSKPTARRMDKVRTDAVAEYQ